MIDCPLMAEVAKILPPVAAPILTEALPRLVKNEELFAVLDVRTVAFDRLGLT